MPPLILASASPRRRRLLGRLGLASDIEESHVDEAVRGPLPVTALVRDLALRKARSVAGTHMTGIVLGADTAVAVDGAVLGKPIDADDAVRMLRLLCGRRHTVATAVAVVDIDGGRERAAVAVTRVTMHAYTDEQIATYIASGEPMDKAGATRSRAPVVRWSWRSRDGWTRSSACRWTSSPPSSASTRCERSRRRRCGTRRCRAQLSSTARSAPVRTS